MLKQVTTGRSKDQARTRPLEQLRSHDELQLGDSPAYSGMIEVEMFGGLR